ncbi:MAG: prolyl oligopeptidase family serine peptidase [Dysgonamonadaceae bacterium]|jgi:dipeptidyl aminopeptidase/acylaminoacyl peptidase|nr:prolyl oligopeptidase family serine peptidase [Dysgonamonadaceae bacterium]
MNLLHKIVVVAFILSSFNVFSQEEIVVKDYHCSKLIPLYSPVKIDSLDVNKKSFADKELLQAVVDFDPIAPDNQILRTDSAGILSLPYFDWDSENPTQDKALQLLSFRIDADRYCKAKVQVLCTEMMEIYVNGKKEKSKETKEDSLSKARSVDLTITMEPPYSYDVVIKRLATFKNFNQSELKTTVMPEKGDTTSQLAVSVDTKRRININDILEGKRLSFSSISPSGNYYIVGFNEVYPGGKSIPSLELREMKTNRLISPFQGSSQPRWREKSDKIVYTKEGAKDKDFYELDVVSMKESMIAKGIKCDSYTLSPNDEFMIIAIREEIPEDTGDLKRLLSPSDRAGSFRGRSSLYCYRFNDRTLQRLTFGKTQTGLEDIRPDSRKILFMTSEEDMSERPFRKNCLFEMDLKTLAMDTLVCDRFISKALYSPDYKKILITGGAEAFDGIGLNIAKDQVSNTYDTQAFILDLQTKAVQPITKDFNPSIASVQWSTADNRIYFSVDEEDYRSVYEYDVKSESFQKLDLQEDIVAGFQVATKGLTALYRGESASNAYRLYGYDLKTKTVRLLADPFGGQLATLELSPMSDWDFVASDGTTIKGRYYLPVDFDPAKKYPMIVYYYGGTSPTTRIFESTYPLQTYAALGYVVYTLQPSGTTGFGQSFSARHVNAWGKMTADEIIEGTQKFCEEHPFVDKTKIGCIGASYGGFMTQYLQTRTDLFAAAVSHAGISSIASYWGEGYWGYAYSASASANSYPWNNPELYVEQSPLFHADKIQTPLLLLHGSVDTNVPIGESIQMYNALKILGKTVEFIRVEGENHAIYAYSKRIKWNKTIHAWFARWLKDQPEWWNAMYPEK